MCQLFVLDKRTSAINKATGLSISAVERDTGIGKDTLRVWERRYGFPCPQRDAAGERVYPLDQVEKLRILRRLLDHGYRPSKLVESSPDELVRLLHGCRSAVHADDEARRTLSLVSLSHSEELKCTLSKSLARLGLQRFVTQTLVPLNAAVGEAWMRGDIGVHDEHLYTEIVQNLLRGAIAAIPAGAPPRVLLTTLPGEEHGLGLLMAQAVLASEGAYCLSLGNQTPLPDICSAAVAGAFDVVALSFSSAYPARKAFEDIAEVRDALPPGVELWAGGQAMAPRGKPLHGVRIIPAIVDTLDAVRAWRSKAE